MLRTACLALLLAASPSFAQDDTGGRAEDRVEGYQSAGDLLRKCRDESSYGRSYCYAYIAAVADSARAYQSWIGTNEPCLPKSTSQGALVDMFEDYLAAHPALTDAQAASVIVPAMQSAFPCRKDVAASAR
jgi:hypothetical protein